MRAWTDKHDALLNALESETLIPPLFERLSGERLKATDKDVRVLRDWTASLKNDPGWELLSKVVDKPDAFPHVFDDAASLGFSPQTDHHHALLFGTMCRRFLDAQNYDAALNVWSRAIDAWERIFETSYVNQLVDDLATTLEADELNEIVNQALTEWVEKTLVSIDDPAGVTSNRVRRDELAFLWDALGSLADRDSDHPTFRNAVKSGASKRAELDTKIVAKFEREFDAVDPTDQGKDDDLVKLLNWYASVYRAIDYTDNGVAAIIPLAVERCWALRKVGRDDDKIFTDILRIVRPFNVALYERIKSGSLFGLNSKCADFLVFEGEQKVEQAARKKIFETGLDICPGHRNSAMLLSYVLLSEVDAIVLKLQVIPSARMMVRWGTQSIEDLVYEGYANLDRVKEIYPFNEKFEATVAKLDAEAERLGVRD